MSTLATELRNKLERTIIQAREVAEAGAKATLEAFAVHYHEPYAHMSPEERKLRNHLRARARQLGDKQHRKGELEITQFIQECAYEHWHRMLFARFLAENDLLIEPEMGIAISLEECEELAKEEGKDLWSLASEFAQRMLPQIFRPNDPVLRVTFASEHRLKLEKLLNDLEPVIFTASDSLGWVYQFWQSKRKKKVNQSGNKIGADELPAVTQLFTEPYMVNFLLDNSLGAWWTGRRLSENDLKNAASEEDLRRKAAIPDVPMEYLRFVQQEDGTWTLAASTFDGWPEHLSELKTLDPCCGSGHFLVAAFLMLVPMRMELEGLTAREAVDAVLRENVHGLELDQRCVELAAFALALSAWKYPGSGGYRPLPDLNVACSGLAINAKKEEWLALAGDNTNLRLALEALYKQFKDAPVLGSLINPEDSLGKGSLFELKWEDVDPLLTKALSGEHDDDKSEMGVVALGVSKAAHLLSEKYQWIITNVPYRSSNDLHEEIKKFSAKKYSDGATDLATTFLLRIFDYLFITGNCSVVIPQNWLVQPTYKALRKRLLSNHGIRTIVRLGPGAFQEISGEVVNVLLLSVDKMKRHDFITMGCGRNTAYKEKIDVLMHHSPNVKSACDQLRNPDSVIFLGDQSNSQCLLGDSASSVQGIKTGEDDRYKRKFWEFFCIPSEWVGLQSTVREISEFGGLEHILYWGECGDHLARKQGMAAWKKKGIAVSQMSSLPCCSYLGGAFDSNMTAIVIRDEKDILPLHGFALNGDLSQSVREFDQSLKPTNSSFEKVFFEKDKWREVSKEKYPNSLPKPYCDDPTQWIFHGHPCGSVIWAEEKKWTAIGPLRTDATVLQVSVARLLGYRWPAELDPKMELSDEQREWVNKCHGLLKYVDEDGIVCIPSVRGEETAEGQLRALLTVALGPDWSPSAEQELIMATGADASNLDEWLRDHFFEQHCKLFHHRPFIWHIWDGRRRDGFHALVNYHKLAEGNGKGRQLLESLTYSYLGDWITRQKEGAKRGEGGAEDRLAAALELQKRLIGIIEGEPPFDIFVRWKPIEDQSIGWEPDINDGVRINIRPFMAPDMPDGSRKGADIPGGRKGAGILRWKPNIKWNKDRGKEPFRSKEQYPWFWKDGEFTGERVNDIHLSINDKQKARKEIKQT